MAFLIIQPIGKRIQVDPQISLLEATRQAGVELVSICGGIGICDSCQIRLVRGQLTAPSQEEQAIFSAEQLSEGYRLACQACALTDATIEVPKESLTTVQRLQIEGTATEVALLPALDWIDISVNPASLDDLRADTTRLRESAALFGWQIQVDPRFRFAPAVLATLSERLRAQGWTGRLVRRGEEVIAFLLLALGTSLPEISTSIVATKRGLGNIAMGNIMGSIGFNNLVIPGAASFLGELSIGNDFISHVPLAMIFSILLLGLMALNDRIITRLEGIMLLTIYILVSVNVI